MTSGWWVALALWGLGGVMAWVDDDDAGWLSSLFWPLVIIAALLAFVVEPIKQWRNGGSDG